MKKFKKRLSIFITLLFLFSILPNFSLRVMAGTNISVDGDISDWKGVNPIAASPDGAWSGGPVANIRNLYLLNDSASLNFFVEGNVPDWGSNGQYIDLALDVNDKDSKYSDSPWNAPYNFNGLTNKPNLHILVRANGNNQVAYASVYSYNNGTKTEILTSSDLKGAQFAFSGANGFEGKIPLSLLGLKNDDIVKAICVLSGNKSLTDDANGAHGAFDVIPEAPENQLQSSWQTPNPIDSESKYSDSYTIIGAATAFTPEFYGISGPATATPNTNSVFTGMLTTEDGKGQIIPADKISWSLTDLGGNPTTAASLDSKGILTVNANNIPKGSFGTKLILTGNYNGVEKSKTITVMRDISPKVNGDGTATFYAEGTSDNLYIVGSFNGWDNKGIAMTKDDSTGVFKIILPLTAGKVQYKFLPLSGSWDNSFTDSYNSNTEGGNSVLNMPGVQISSDDSVQAGKSIQLTAKAFDESGNSTPVEPIWKLETPNSKITIDNTNQKLSVAADAAPQDITLVASVGSYTTKKVIKVVEKLYSFTINYYRYKNDYNNWDLWLWEDNQSGKGYSFNMDNQADSGFVKAQYEFTTNKINFIVRNGGDSWTSQEPGGDRAIQIPAGSSDGATEVWIIQGDSKVYYNKADIDVSDRVSSALMDSTTDILATTSKDISNDAVATFKLIDATNPNDKKDIPVEVSRVSNNEVKLSIKDSSQIDVTHIYEVQGQSINPGKVIMRNILNDSKFYYDGEDLGLNYSRNSGVGSSFKLWAPTASKVSVCLYDTPGTYSSDGKVNDNASDIKEIIDMSRASNGVWTSNSVHEDITNKYYMYKIEFADGKVNYAVDPYARSVSANGQRSAIIDLTSTNPVGWGTVAKPKLLKPTDSIIYELHVRDLSTDTASGITNKGKFKAFTETGTKGPDGVSTGIDHLKELGITHVHLLPSFDYASVNENKLGDKQYNWGYDPQNYNVPEGSYSTDPSNPNARAEEFKEAVQALHQNGIRVIMDVVYNHTYSTGSSPFDSIVPGYFYRSGDDGKYTNGSGCGNEVASERLMVRKYIKDSVKYWATQYGIDGFRFDLMGLIDTDTVAQLTRELQQEVDPSIIIYGEPWTGGSTALPASRQTTKGAQKDKNFAVFNDNFRGAIKGDSDGNGQGFATGAIGKENDIITGIKGAIDDFTNSPSETINYVTAHDNLNLWDKVIKTEGLDSNEGFLNMKDGALAGDDASKYSSVEDAIAKKAHPHNGVDLNNVLANETVKRSILANGIVLTAQGIPFIQAGDEFLKTKFGNNNSYNSPDAINMIRWKDKADFKPVFDYYKGLIELRRLHPAFRMDTAAAVRSNLQVIKSDNNIVVFELKNNANSDSWKNIVVAYNGNNAAQSISLPSTGNWTVVVNEKAAGTKTLNTFTSGTTTIQPLSMMVLYDEGDNSIAVPTKIDISPASLTMEPGTYKFVTGVVKDQNGRIMPSENVKWTSSNTAAAMIDSNGQIHALGSGTTIITATDGKVTASITLKVCDLVPTSLIIKGSNTVYATKTSELSVTILDQFGQEMFNETPNWESSNMQIATVNSNGQVTGIKAGTAVIKASIGNASATISVIVKANVKKYIEFRYDRPSKDYDGWNIWTWSTGAIDGEQDFTKVTDGVDIAKFEIGPDASKVGFVLRKGTDWKEKDSYGDDRYIAIDPDQIVTKVTVKSGVKDFDIVPAVKGPILYGGSLTFYYRDENLYENDQMGSIDNVQVKVNGETHDMQYDAKNEYFTYTMKVSPGKYDYSFIVSKDGSSMEVTDPYNTVDGKSSIEYKKKEFNIISTLSKAKVSYNQNSVLSIKLQTNDGTSVNPRNIYLDLSAIGGSSKVEVDKSLMAYSLSVKDSITSGDKNIKITVIDESGDEHTQDAALTVLSRTSVGAMDFDWDEARIYFMLTDRFFNGDRSNDDPHGEKYDKSNLETYHGGDFKGLTQKLDYLKDLGINTIWITPIVENVDFNMMKGSGGSQYSYHGYWAKNFENIDPHLGTLNDFKNLIDMAHDKNIKIMVDVVLNHAGYGMRATDQNSSGASNYPTDSDKQRFAGMLRDAGGTDQVQGDVAGLPDFKTENPEVRQKLIDWQTSWLDKAKTSKGNTIDYFRVDTANNVDDTTERALKNALAIKDPNFKMIGEGWGANIDANNGKLGTGEFDSMLDFSFKYTAQNFVEGKINEAETALEHVNNNINNTVDLGEFLSSHDEDDFIYRIMSQSDQQSYKNDVDSKYINEVKPAVTLQLTGKGQPVIYYGEELGATGKNAGDMAQGQLSENRKDMPWDRLDASKSENQKYIGLHDHYQKLLKIRDAFSKIFSKGTREMLGGGDADKFLVFDRIYNDKSIVVAINNDTSARDVTVRVPFAANSVVTDVYNEKNYTVDSNQMVTFELPDTSKGGTVVLYDYSTDIKTTPVDQQVFIQTVDGSVNKDILRQTIDNSKTAVLHNGDVDISISPNDLAKILENLPVLQSALTINKKSSLTNNNAISAMAGESLLKGISLENNLPDGKFGAKVEVKVQLTQDQINASSGKSLYVYYYNPVTRLLEVMPSRFENGYVIFTTTHCSDYFISTADLYRFTAGAGSGTGSGANPAKVSSRLYGATRIETAVQVADSLYSGKIDNVIVSTGYDFPDALAGSVLAKKLNAPILLLGKSYSESKAALDYISSHLNQNGTIYVLGGTGAVDNSFINTFSSMGYGNIKRIGGADRIETSTLIADTLNAAVGTSVIIATSEDFPDALSISSAASLNGYPILLSNKNHLSENVIDKLKTINPSKVYIVGGTGVLSSNIIGDVKKASNLSDGNIIRLSGNDRYDTAIAIANYFKLSTDTAVVATGNDFPDALVGSVVAANKKAPIVLVGDDADRQTKYINDNKITNLILLGGEGAISKNLENKLLQ